MTQDSSIFAMYKLASVIERSFNTQSSEKIIKLILIHISHALKYENSKTKNFLMHINSKIKVIGHL